MTDEIFQKTLDNIMRSSIEEVIESYNIDRIKHFDFKTDDDDDFIEVSYSDLVKEAKRDFKKRYGAWLDDEIYELKRKLNKL